MNLDLSRFTAVTSDSREVRPGCLFIAVRGGTRDGHDFLKEVIAKGAQTIVGERALPSDLTIPYIQVTDSRRALGELASKFYANPSHVLKVVGVTGTSGKTTVTYLVESVLRSAGFKAGVIGTVNFRYDGPLGEVILPSSHTTPGPVELQRLLMEMKNEGVSHVVMEVSSHSLSQARVAGIEFDVSAFTNLTPEHLDFHKDMEGYFNAKKILFTDLFETAKAADKSPVRVVNLDDPYGYRLAEEFEDDVLTFSVSDPALVSGIDLHDSLEGISGAVGGVEIRSNLMGRFNISNILTAIGIAKALGIADSQISAGINRLVGVPGRLERIPNSKGIHVFVDYAHKPDALEKVLKNMQSYRNEHRLITVFGCGGDRDRTKRPVMGEIAQKLSDQVIVTSDNPRTEDPDSIIQEIVKGMTGKSYHIEPDRRQAIRRAIAQAVPGDLVLIAGKGHEDYQIIGSLKHPFDDRKVAAEALDQG
jgi:UDP-N-acetylmuramoyl-L-alanyl-D-glutamate--2,6-diaminopimelate ligase